MDKIQLLNYLEEFISDDRKQRFEEILQQRTKFITVAIEDVYQVHNTSAVIRSCETFGIQEAHIIQAKYGKRLDTEITMGAHKWVDSYRYKNAQDSITALRNKGYSIVATTPHANDCNLHDFNLDKKVALFFGTERSGLSPYILENADQYLKIPMVGFTESLNISVSAAIILQHLTYELKKSSLPWQLTPFEILEKRLDWTKKSIKSIDYILERFQKTD